MEIFKCSPPYECFSLGSTIINPYYPILYRICINNNQTNNNSSTSGTDKTIIIHFTVNQLSQNVQDRISALFINYTNYFVHDPTILNGIPNNFIALQNTLISQGTINNTIIADYEGSNVTVNLLGYVNYNILKFISSYATAGFFKTFLHFAYGISQDDHSIDSLSQIMLTFSSSEIPSYIGTYPLTTPYATSYNGLLLTYSLPPISSSIIPINTIQNAISNASASNLSLIGAFPSSLSSQLKNLNQYCIASESVLEKFAQKYNYQLYYSYHKGIDKYMTISDSNSTISVLTLPTTLNALGYSYDTTQPSGSINFDIYYNRALNIYRYLEKFNL